MRKIIILGLIGLLTLPELSFAETRATDQMNQQQIFKRKKAKAYRKKKGFMWGLFRKNDCGCPKH